MGQSEILPATDPRQVQRFREAMARQREQGNFCVAPRPAATKTQADPWRKGVASMALGVHPKQRQEAMADAAKKGVPTEFNKDGDPVFHSRKHRKQYCQAYGFYDKNGGYGDPAPGSHKGGY